MADLAGAAGGSSGTSDAAGGSLPAGDVSSSEGQSTGTQDPTRSSGSTTEDPEFEYEVDSQARGADGKFTKEKKKFKLSEARSRFATHDAREGKLSQREQLVQKYITEQLDPLNGMVEDMRKDPTKIMEFAKRLGVDFDKAVQVYAKRQVDLASMTQEQRDLLATKEELANYKKQDETRQQEHTQREQQAAITRESERVQQEIVGAAKEVNLPADPSVLMLMTNFLRSQVHQGIQPDTKAAAGYVRKVLDTGFKSMIKGLTYDQIRKDYPQILTMVREGDILEVKGGFQGNGAKKPPQPPTRQSKGYMSPSEFQRYLQGEE